MSIDSNAAILHAPDLLADEVDPETIAGRWHAPATPETALAAAIIRTAVDEARGIVAGDFRGPHKGRIIAAARAWLTDTTSPNAPGTWGLAFCAEVLGVHPEEIAKRAPRATVVGAALTRTRHHGSPVRVVGRKKRGAA